MTFVGFRRSNSTAAVEAYLALAALAQRVVGLRRRLANFRRKLVVSAHFDAEFYRFCHGDYLRDEIAPLDHYLAVGSQLRFDPNPDFSSQSYVAVNRDLRYAGDPFYDFLRSKDKSEKVSTSSARKVAYFTSKGFDADYYLSTYADVRDAHVDPLHHYVEKGWREGRDPNPTFCTDYYLSQYEDARSLGVNPLYHYVRHGAAESRRPSALPAGAGARLGVDKSATTLFSRLVRRQPEFTTKWLRPNFLALGLSELQRARCFIFHYDFLIRSFDEAALDDMLFREIEVWATERDGRRHAIVLRRATPSLVEGELSFEFLLDGASIYALSFTVTPEALSSGGAGEPQILISQLQGVRGRWDDIKQSSRRMKDVSPPFALMAALQGFGICLGIERVSGVSARHQPVRENAHAGDFNATYDHFFLSIGATPVNDMLFTAPLPLVEKPLSAVKPGHRIRTRVKRELKREIAAASAQAIAPLRRLTAALSGAPERFQSLIENPCINALGQNEAPQRVIETAV